MRVTVELVRDGAERDSYIITLDPARQLAELNIVRGLPYRKFEPTRNIWVADFVIENWERFYEGATDVVIALDGTPIPTQRATKVDSATGKTLMLRVPGDRKNVDLCRGIPDAKLWVQDGAFWRVKPSRRNVEYIKANWPTIHWTPEATEVAHTSEAPHVENKTELERLKDAARADYKFYTDPFEHQLAAFALSRHVESYGLFMEPGTGKSKVDIDSSAWMFQNGLITGCFILCPKSIKSNWAAEIEKHLPPCVKRRVVVYASGKTNPMEAAMSDSDGTLDFLIMNVDALVTERGIETAKRFLAAHVAKMTVDESSRIKNQSAKRTKACCKLGKIAKYRRILTGTPVTQSPLDVFAQFQFLDPNILGFGSYYSFRNRFTIMGGWQNKQVLRYVNLDELQGLVQPYSFRVTKEECLDLPEKIYQKLSIELSPKQREIYDRLANDMEAEVEGLGTVTATIALTLLLRFQQIVGGFFPAIMKNEVEAAAVQRVVTAKPLPGGNPKLDALMDFIEDRPGKIIIWARFRPELAIISDALRAKYGVDSVVEFHGGVNDAGRKDAIGKFQGWPDQPHNPACRFFVGQTETGGMGITLTEAHDVVYFSNSFSLESRLQSEDRAHRIGQVNHVTYTDLVAKDTIDDKLLEVLRKKLSLANVVTGDNLREWL